MAELEPKKVVDIDIDIDGKSGMETQTIDLQPEPDLRFTGKMISSSSGMALFRTYKGRYICYQFDPFSDDYRFTVCKKLIEVVAFFGNSMQAKFLYSAYPKLEKEFFRWARKELRLTQCGLAENLGWSSKQVSNIERGVAPVTQQTMLALECLLNRREKRHPIFRNESSMVATYLMRFDERIRKFKRNKHEKT